MKSKQNYLFLACLAIITWFVSCESPEVQKPLVLENNRIQNRNVPDDCNDCPVTDCCCSVEYLAGNSVTLWLCGTTTGLSNIECGPIQPGNCNEIEGYILPLSVGTTDYFDSFCMAENTSFYIQNRNTSGGSTDLRITCQSGQIGPQSVDVALSPGNSAYYTVNGDCEIHSCD